MASVHAKPGGLEGRPWLWGLGLVLLPLGAIVVYSVTDEPRERTVPRDKSATAPPDTTEPNAGESPEAKDAPPSFGATPVVPPMPTPAAQPAAVVEPAPAEAKPETVAKIAEARRLAATDPAKSRDILKDALFYDPENSEALELLGLKMLQDEKHRDAKDLAKRCLESQPDNQNCWAIAHYALEPLPQVPYMLKATEACLADSPDNVGCLHGMVNYHLMNGNYGKAGEFVDNMIDSSPDAPLTLLAEGRIKGANGDYGEALTLFEAACDAGEKQACYRADALRDEGWKPAVPSE